LNHPEDRNTNHFLSTSLNNRESDIEIFNDCNSINWDFLKLIEISKSPCSSSLIVADAAFLDGFNP
jgi:hypothetical protein